jgi:cobalt-zinc-cadmium efflux system protein
MGHDHAHHAHGHAYGRAFGIGIALNCAFVIVEAFYGVLAQSMALVADAGHNLSDVLALGLAWGASLLARREPSARYTYGLRSTSILAALLNATILLLVTGAIAWESVQRLNSPVVVASATMMWVAAIGILINGATALLFAGGRKHDLNIRAAFLHMVADAAVSGGVVIAALGIRLTGWQWLDPLVGLAISAVIVVGTWGLLRDTLRLTLAAVPGHVDPERVRSHLRNLPGVAEVHDLHIWGLSTTETALTVHLVIPGGHPGDKFLATLAHELQHDFRIGHATLQIETGDTVEECALAPDHVV